MIPFHFRKEYIILRLQCFDAGRVLKMALFNLTPTKTRKTYRDKISVARFTTSQGFG